MKTRQTIFPAAEFRRQLEAARNRANTTLRELGYLYEEGQINREVSERYNHLTMTLEVVRDLSSGNWLLRYGKPNAYQVFGTWYLGGTRGFTTRDSALEIAREWHSANSDWYEVFETVDLAERGASHARAAE